MKDIKFIMILFIFLIIFVILLANNVKNIDNMNKKVNVNWENNTCTYE